MPIVPIHQEFHLAPGAPPLAWAARAPKAGAHINLWWLYLAMCRANQLGLTLGDAGLATVAATAAAALSVCEADADGFRVTHDYGRLKDFVKPFLSGSLGAGLTLLQTMQAGYPWMAHWEDCGGPTADAHPDFVFFRDGTATAPSAVCLVESKGSRGPTSGPEAQADWERQIWPHRQQRLPLPDGSHLVPTEGRLVANELPGPSGRKRFRSTVVQGQFPRGLGFHAATFSRATLGTMGWTLTPSAGTRNRVVQTPPADAVGIQRACLRHVCRLLDLPATEASFAAPLSGEVDRDNPNRADLFFRALHELSRRRTPLDWGPDSRPDDVVVGLPQRIVMTNGTEWEVKLYCQYMVLWSILRDTPAQADHGAAPRQAEWADRGGVRIRLQGGDGVGLLARQSSGGTRD
ncbi:hypothetical protein BKK79_37395 (plasmid) [Cupriavidus sp. USMAA2-4]|uniref:hypothetical protein n=1 Tax=Cupriavidus sp. USMAA2-4 TaxID=876364 RepID=UPI0008A6AC76|nr:hypothetical protein [Cupriavidus sp. USMAA2-4]AOY97611.1 hypothetical protein BKK79_37395 [Cupriavidus sp. USMAA2-4]